MIFGRAYPIKSAVFIGRQTFTAGGSTAYTLSATTGTYVVSGVSTTLTSSRILTAVKGAYLLAGNPATETLTRRITAVKGVYTVTGNAATLTSSRTLTATTGAYVISGKAVAIGRVTTLSAVTGTYSVSGKTITNPVALSIRAVKGSYVLASNGANLVANIATTAGGGKQSTWQKGVKNLAKTSNQLHVHQGHRHEIKKAAAVLSSLGGIARAKSLTATQRSNIATTAAKARWR